MHEAILEDGFDDGADTVGDRVECRELSLHIGRERGVRSRTQVRGLRSTTAHVDVDPVDACDHIGTGFLQLGENRIEMIRSRVERAYPATSDRAGDKISAGLDAIGLHSILRAVQTRYAIDNDFVGARAPDLGAHGDQELGEVNDLGLTRRVLEHGLTFGESRGHHQIFGARHCHRVEHQPSTPQTIRPRADVAVLDCNLGTHRLQASHMDIHRSCADGAATRQRDVSLTEPRQQRPEDQNRGAHRFDELVRRYRIGERTRIHLDLHAFVDGHRDAHATEQLDHGGDVLQVRNVTDGHRLGREQRASQDGQRRVLRTGDTHLTLERTPAFDMQFVHMDYGSAISAPPLPRASTLRWRAHGSRVRRVRQGSGKPVGALRCCACRQTRPRRYEQQSGSGHRTRRPRARRAGPRATIRRLFQGA